MARTRSGPTKSLRKPTVDVKERARDATRQVQVASARSRARREGAGDDGDYVSTRTTRGIRDMVSRTRSASRASRAAGERAYAVDDDDEENDDDDEEEEDEDEEDSDASGYDPGFALKPFPFDSAFLAAEKAKRLDVKREPDASTPLKILAHSARAPPAHDGPPILAQEPVTPSPLPEWPHPPHSSTCELLVLASAHILHRFPETNHATLAHCLANELLRPGRRTGSRVVHIFLAEGARRARHGGSGVNAVQPRMFAEGPPGEQRSELVVRATAHLVRVCPSVDHDVLARALAQALDVGGEAGLVELVRAIAGECGPSLLRAHATPAPPSRVAPSRRDSSTPPTSRIAPAASVRTPHNRTSGQPAPPPVHEQTSPARSPRPAARPCKSTNIHTPPRPAPARRLPASRPAPLPVHTHAPVPPVPSSASIPSSASVPTPVPVPSPTTAAGHALALLAGLHPADRVRLALRLAGALAVDAARTVGGAVVRAVRAKLVDGDVDSDADLSGDRGDERAREAQADPCGRGAVPPSQPVERAASASTRRYKRPADTGANTREPPAKRVRVRSDIYPPTSIATSVSPPAAAVSPTTQPVRDDVHDDKARLRHRPQPQRRAYVQAQAQAAARAKVRRALRG